MNTTSKPKIFISFSTKNIDLCKSIVSKLDSEHYEFWYQDKIDIGQDYRPIIKENIDSSVATLILLSDSFLNSKFIQEEEVPWIINKDDLSLIYEIIPLQIEECEWESLDFLKEKQIYPSRTKALDLDNSVQIENIRKHIFNYLDNAGYIEKKGWFR
tara:strand:- start:504 stop:974 length:471 start_codon:yes stop_codon:yes gene_type:complete